VKQQRTEKKSDTRTDL